MQYLYIIIDDDHQNVQEILNKVEHFPEYFCAGIADNREQALNMILELRPHVVFLGITPLSNKSNLSLFIIIELYRYLNTLPLFVVMADTPKLALDAIKTGVFDYLLKPLNKPDIIKCLLKIKKSDAGAAVIDKPPLLQLPAPALVTPQQEAPAVKENHQICIKSYGDYQFISLHDIIYLKADNNTTDFFLKNGRKLTAYKTLKFYENTLPSFFYRIHNSHIININYVTRISTGKSLCYLNNGELYVPFSKTFKENIDAIIKEIASDYL